MAVLSRAREYILHLTFHDLALLDAASLYGVQGASKDGDSQGHFLVARNGRVDRHAARLALQVQNGAAVAFGTNTKATKGNEARSARLAAALQVHAADTSL